jgi:hypothetical protein
MTLEANTAASWLAATLERRALLCCGCILCIAVVLFHLGYTNTLLADRCHKIEK